MFKMRAKMITVGLLGTAMLLPLESAKANQVGSASWYALHSRTASGEMMNPSQLTAAHRSLPFGTKVLVENLNNGRSVVVRINDRGPFVGGRIIDLSKAAAASIGMINSGTAKVRVTPAGGGALAALGEKTRKATKETAAKQKPAKAKSTASRVPSKPKSAGQRRPIKVKSTASMRSPKAKRVAKVNPSRGKVTSALGPARAAKSAAKGRNAKAPRAAVSKRMRGERRSRDAAVRTRSHPYPVLGRTPGFVQTATDRPG